jgi:hypothetical protein
MVSGRETRQISERIFASQSTSLLTMRHHHGHVHPPNRRSSTHAHSLGLRMAHFWGCSPRAVRDWDGDARLEVEPQFAPTSHGCLTLVLPPSALSPQPSAAAVPHRAFPLLPLTAARAGCLPFVSGTARQHCHICRSRLSATALPGALHFPQPPLTSICQSHAYLPRLLRPLFPMSTRGSRQSRPSVTSVSHSRLSLQSVTDVGHSCLPMAVRDRCLSRAFPWRPVMTVCRSCSAPPSIAAICHVFPSQLPATSVSRSGFPLPSAPAVSHRLPSRRPFTAARNICPAQLSHVPRGCFSQRSPTHTLLTHTSRTATPLHSHSARALRTPPFHSTSLLFSSLHPLTTAPYRIAPHHTTHGRSADSRSAHPESPWHAARGTQHSAIHDPRSATRGPRSAVRDVGRPSHSEMMLLSCNPRQTWRLRGHPAWM